MYTTLIDAPVLQSLDSLDIHASILRPLIVFAFVVMSNSDCYDPQDVEHRKVYIRYKLHNAICLRKRFGKLKEKEQISKFQLHGE